MVVYLQHVVEHVVDQVVAIDYLYVLLAHNHRRKVALVAEVDYGMGLVNGMRSSRTMWSPYVQSAPVASM